MSNFSSRFLTTRKFIRPIIFSSVPTQTHSSSSISSSKSLLLKPIKRRFSYCLVDSTSRKTVFWGLRADHTMASQSTQPQSVHDFTVKDAKGNDVDLSNYKGKVLLIVNVASQCGLTNSNYTELSKLYEKYKDQGLEILAFPCNQFGSQEPGTNEQIQDFVCTRFKAEYPIFDKPESKNIRSGRLLKYVFMGLLVFLGLVCLYNGALFSTGLPQGEALFDNGVDPVTGRFYMKRHFGDLFDEDERNSEVSRSIPFCRYLIRDTWS